MNRIYYLSLFFLTYFNVFVYSITNYFDKYIIIYIYNKIKVPHDNNFDNISY